MALRAKIVVRGQKRADRVLKALNISESPEAVRAGLIDTAKVGEAAAKRLVSGPRPRRLDRVTGELAGSIDTRRDELPRAIEWGTPIFWAEFYETRNVGRFRGRTFIRPSLNEAIEAGEEIFARHWEAQVGRAIPGPA